MTDNEYLQEVLRTERDIRRFIDDLALYLQNKPHSHYPVDTKQIKKHKHSLTHFFSRPPKHKTNEPAVFDERWAVFMRNCEKYIVNKTLEAIKDLKQLASIYAADFTKQPETGHDPYICCVAAIIDNLERFAERQHQRNGYSNEFLSDVEKIAEFFKKEYEIDIPDANLGRKIFEDHLYSTLSPEHVDIDTMYFVHPEERHRKGEPPDFVERSMHFSQQKP